MSGAVVTLTLNPAIDETVTLDTLRPGSVHGARAVRFDAGGKGVNVASCLADWGAPVVVTGVLGEANDSVFKALFAVKSIDDRFFRMPGDTRVNIKLVHDSATTDINLPGLEITSDILAKLKGALLALAEQNSFFVLAGSTPAGVDAGIYRDLTAALSARGSRVVLDASGDPLKAALSDRAAHLPFCVKPNRAELEGWAGHALPTTESLVKAARGLLARGVGIVAISLGEEGALFASGSETALASLPAIACASTVGAGDAMVAGIVAALRENVTLDRVARLGTAFAAAKLGRPGPNLPARAEVEALAAKVAITSLNHL